MSFELPRLDYAYDALEPLIDARTMEIHHTKHHAAYTTNLNNLLAGTELEGKSIEEVMSNVEKYPGRGTQQWGRFLQPQPLLESAYTRRIEEPKGALNDAIVRDFGSVEEFKAKFAAAAATRFGSGWAWLVKVDNRLVVGSTANQDNPLMSVSEVKGTPILGIDVWEHAYYLNYQNRKPDYVEAFWQLINWDVVADYFNA